MSTLMLDPTQLDEESRQSARVGVHAASQQKSPTDVTMRVQGETFDVPPVLAHAFFRVMDALVRGKRVSIATEEEALTTTEAADLLNVSRPHLVKLLKQEKIPFHRVGSHRRVYRDDVLAYKSAQQETAAEAMQALAQQAQKLDMGY